MFGGFFAIFTPSPEVETAWRRQESPADTAPLPDGTPIGIVQTSYAAAFTNRAIGKLLEWERDERGGFTLVRTAAELESAKDAGVLAGIMHIEGAEAIGPDLAALDVYHAAGLRSLGLVWSRANLFAEGVPFAFPSSPDTGPGLTAHGRALVRRLNELRVMIDLSHLNERGFWDVANLSDAPLVATHSNAHAVSPSARNLTDEQLRAVRESEGVVGLNYAVGFLDPEGERDTALPLEVLVRHVDHMVDLVGIDGVALGSDFDGAGIPDAIGDVGGVQNLLGALEAAGYDAEALEKIAWRNWVRVLRSTWGE